MTEYFRLAHELENKFHAKLSKNEVHFRPSMNSLSMISVSSLKPEIGCSCKNHDEWSDEIIESYIQIIDTKEPPKRPTPEKSLQAWMIKYSQNHDFYLPFERKTKFITSELAITNSRGEKIVSDIIGYDMSSQAIVVIELKSERLLTRLVEQVDNFEKIIQENENLFKEILNIHGIDNLNQSISKAIVWPYAETSPLKKLEELGIQEYTYTNIDDYFRVQNLVYNDA